MMSDVGYGAKIDRLVTAAAIKCHERVSSGNNVTRNDLKLVRVGSIHSGQEVTMIERQVCKQVDGE